MPIAMQITLVGKIVSVQEQSTNLTLMLDDGTGRVELKYWIDNDEAELVRVSFASEAHMCPAP